MSSGIQNPAAFKRCTTFLILFVSALSLLTVTGWLFNRPILASLQSAYIPMAPASALIFLKVSGTFGLSRMEPVQFLWRTRLLDIGKMGEPDGALRIIGPRMDDESVKANGYTAIPTSCLQFRKHE